MENQSVIQIINGVDSIDKGHVRDISSIILDEFNSGKVDPFIFAGKVEFLLQSLESAMEQIRNNLVHDIDVYGKDAEIGVVRNGIQFKRKEAGVKYDYSENKIWNMHNEHLMEIKNQMKEVETFIKTLHRPTPVVDPDTGEVVTYLPAKRTSKTIVEITIPKAK